MKRDYFVRPTNQVVFCPRTSGVNGKKHEAKPSAECRYLHEALGKNRTVEWAPQNELFPMEYAKNKVFE
jgi:hypothetical protein